MTDVFSNSKFEPALIAKDDEAGDSLSPNQSQVTQRRLMRDDAPSENQSFRDELVALIPRLRRYAYSLTGSTPDGDDLVQTALERSMSREDQFTGENGLQGWVFSVLRSCWNNEIRSRRVRVGNGIVDAESLDDSSPDTCHESLQMRRDLHSLLMTLPENHRSAIVLIDVEGMSYAEAAEALDIPRGTLMSRLARGRDKLIASMEQSPLSGHSSETTNVRGQ